MKHPIQGVIFSTPWHLVVHARQTGSGVLTELARVGCVEGIFQAIDESGDGLLSEDEMILAFELGGPWDHEWIPIGLFV